MPNLTETEKNNFQKYYLDYLRNCVSENFVPMANEEALEYIHAFQLATSYAKAQNRKIDLKLNLKENIEKEQKLLSLCLLAVKKPEKINLSILKTIEENIQFLRIKSYKGKLIYDRVEFNNIMNESLISFVGIIRPKSGVALNMAYQLFKEKNKDYSIGPNLLKNFRNTNFESIYKLVLDDEIYTSAEGKAYIGTILQEMTTNENAEKIKELKEIMLMTIKNIEKAREQQINEAEKRNMASSEKNIKALKNVISKEFKEIIQSIEGKKQNEVIKILNTEVQRAKLEKFADTLNSIGHNCMNVAQIALMAGCHKKTWNDAYAVGSQIMSIADNIIKLGGPGGGAALAGPYGAIAMGFASICMTICSKQKEVQDPCQVIYEQNQKNHEEVINTVNLGFERLMGALSLIFSEMIKGFQGLENLILDCQATNNQRFDNIDYMIKRLENITVKASREIYTKDLLPILYCIRNRSISKLDEKTKNENLDVLSNWITVYCKNPLITNLIKQETPNLENESKNTAEALNILSGKFNAVESFPFLISQLKNVVPEFYMKNIDEEKLPNVFLLTNLSKIYVKIAMEYNLNEYAIAKVSDTLTNAGYQIKNVNLVLNKIKNDNVLWDTLHRSCMHYRTEVGKALFQYRKKWNDKISKERTLSDIVKNDILISVEKKYLLDNLNEYELRRVIVMHLYSLITNNKGLQFNEFNSMDSKASILNLTMEFFDKQDCELIENAKKGEKDAFKKNLLNGANPNGWDDKFQAIHYLGIQQKEINNQNTVKEKINKEKVNEANNNWDKISPAIMLDQLLGYGKLLEHENCIRVDAPKDLVQLHCDPWHMGMLSKSMAWSNSGLHPWQPVYDAHVKLVHDATGMTPRITSRDPEIKPITFMLNSLQFPMAMLYCANGYDIEESIKYFQNAFQYANENHWNAIVQKYIVREMNKNNGLINKKDLRKAYQLYKSCEGSITDPATILFKSLYETNLTCLLWITCILGDLKAINIVAKNNPELIKKIVNEAIPEANFTPLMMAVYCRNKGVVEFLLENGANCNAKFTTIDPHPGEVDATKVVDKTLNENYHLLFLALKNKDWHIAKLIVEKLFETMPDKMPIPIIELSLIISNIITGLVKPKNASHEKESSEILDQTQSTTNYINIALSKLIQKTTDKEKNELEREKIATNSEYSFVRLKEIIKPIALLINKYGNGLKDTQESMNSLKIQYDKAIILVNNLEKNKPLLTLMERLEELSSVFTSVNDQLHLEFGAVYEKLNGTDKNLKDEIKKMNKFIKNLDADKLAKNKIDNGKEQQEQFNKLLEYFAENSNTQYNPDFVNIDDMPNIPNATVNNKENADKPNINNNANNNINNNMDNKHKADIPIEGGDSIFQAVFSKAPNSYLSNEDIKAKREEMADKISKMKSNDEILSLIEIHLYKLISTKNDKSNLFKIIREEALKNYDKTKDKGTAYAKLKEALIKNKYVLNYIRNNKDRINASKDIKTLSNQDHFNYALNLDNGTLYTLIDANKNLSRLFEKYLVEFKNVYDFKTLMEKEKTCIKEYVDFIKTNGNYLIPKEIRFMAKLFNIEISLYSCRPDGSHQVLIDTYNEGATKKVAICFDGKGNYRRIDENFIRNQINQFNQKVNYVPILEDNIPKREYNIPKAEYNVPKAECNVPKDDYNVPKADKDIPNIDVGAAQNAANKNKIDADKADKNYNNDKNSDYRNPINLGNNKKIGDRTREGLFDYYEKKKGNQKPIVKEAKEKLSNYLSKIGYESGKAVGEGDCFFDSFAQGLEHIQVIIPPKYQGQFGYKKLRQLCDDYAKQNRLIKDHWLKKEILKQDDYQNYLTYIQFTAPEMVKNKEDFLSPTDIAIWGRPDIEGRVICDVLKVRLHVLEIFEVDNKVVFNHQLINSEKSVTISDKEADELYKDEIVIHMAAYQNSLHFVPLLSRSIKAKYEDIPGVIDLKSKQENEKTKENGKLKENEKNAKDKVNKETIEYLKSNFGEAKPVENKPIINQFKNAASNNAPNGNNNGTNQKNNDDVKKKENDLPNRKIDNMKVDNKDKVTNRI